MGRLALVLEIFVRCFRSEMLICHRSTSSNELAKKPKQNCKESTNCVFTVPIVALLLPLFSGSPFWFLLSAFPFYFSWLFPTSFHTYILTAEIPHHHVQPAQSEMTYITGKPRLWVRQTRHMLEEYFSYRFISLLITHSSPQRSHSQPRFITQISTPMVTFVWIS